MIVALGACLAITGGCITDRVNVDGKVGGIDYVSLGESAIRAAYPELAAYLPSRGSAAGSVVVVNPVAGVTPDVFWRYTGEARTVAPGDKLDASDIHEETVYVVIRKPREIINSAEVPFNPLPADAELTDEDREVLELLKAYLKSQGIEIPGVE